MHESYDDDEHDNYDDDYYNYDYGDQYDPYKFYFKFDVSGTPLSDWIADMINNVFKNPINDIDQSFNITNIPGFPVVSFPVNSYFPDTENESKNLFLYLGNNYQNQPIWKNKYLVRDQINILYKNHIGSYPEYFIKQPTYYKGLFDILN